MRSTTKLRLALNLRANGLPISPRLWQWVQAVKGWPEARPTIRAEMVRRGVLPGPK